MEPVIGKHYAPEAQFISGWHGAAFFTTSVGVSLVLPKSRGGWKLGPAKVRITGENSEGGVCEIDLLAEHVARLLDMDLYDGPRNLTVGSRSAQRIMSSLAMVRTEDL